jgi:hypothetical protein
MLIVSNGAKRLNVLSGLNVSSHLELGTDVRVEIGPALQQASCCGNNEFIAADAL